MCKNINDNDGDDRDVLRSLASKILAARDDFFEYVSTFDGSVMPEDDGLSFLEEGEEPQVHYDSLWTFFDYWALKVAVDMDPKRHLWLDPRTDTNAIWAQFARLLPTIYLMICEAYDKDPSKIDLIQRDPVTGKETRVERRVKTKLPEENLLESSDAWGESEDTSDTSPELRLERGIVMYLLTGAFDKWPKPFFGPAGPGGESTMFV